MSDGPTVAGGAIRHAPLRSPHKMVLGLNLLPDDAEWLQVDADRASDLREKRRLLAEAHAQVFGAQPGSEAGQGEVLRAVLAWLRTHHPERIGGDDAAIELPELGETLRPGDGAPPLELASRLVQEDLCLMESVDGEWRLTAASVCFPTRWDLPSKVGRTLTEIHDPVPGYRATLGRPSERFFDGLAPGRVAVRANWSLADTPDLFQPLHGNRCDEPVTHANVGRRVWLRAERQTLRRFPESGAILFTIRVHRDRLDALADAPERARLLAADLRTLPDALAEYKSIPELREPVLAFLDEVAR